MRDYPHIRLFVEHPLQTGTTLTLADKQAHYLTTVMRLSEGNMLAAFNGVDGEWRAELLHGHKKKEWVLKISEKVREQKHSPDLWLVFAPLKHTRMDMTIEKATELGISKLVPVLTQHGVVRSINEERIRSVCMEAAEQSGRLDVPEILPIQPLHQLLGSWPEDRTLFYGDESGVSPSANHVLKDAKSGLHAVLIGPEGGFARAEFELLQRLPFAQGISLGPRVMRADTAVIAALTCIQAWLGDWDQRPAFKAKG